MLYIDCELKRAIIVYRCGENNFDHENLFALGIKAEVYYVDRGMVNRYALNFTVMIPAHISDINFSWQSLVDHSVSELLILD